VLAFKASGMPALRQHPVARYLELVVGYGARRRESEFDTAGKHSRHLYLGLGLNLTEVLRSTAFRDSPAPSSMQRTTETVLEYVQVPGTAVVVDHKF
jgi:hypothetical protein